MRHLTKEEIERLATRQGVRRIAVENFLGTMGEVQPGDAIGNLYLDARLYKWNSATVRAIEVGIRKAQGQEAPPGEEKG